MEGEYVYLTNEIGDETTVGESPGGEAKECLTIRWKIGLVKCSGIYVIVVSCIQERVPEDEQSRHVIIIVTVIRNFCCWFSGERKNAWREDKEAQKEGGGGDSSSCDSLH